MHSHGIFTVAFSFKVHKLKYQNRRYGNPEAMRHYAMWYGTTANLAKALRRSERSVRDWLSGAAKVPFWVPELMRLQYLEHCQTVYQITGRQIATRLGTATTGAIIDAGTRFRPQPWPDEQKPQETTLRLVDFDQRKTG